MQATVDILAPIATIIASVAVVYGIKTWHKEFIGKRQIELAEDTLTLFYEAQDAIQYIRSMFGHSGEGKTREPGPDENDDEKRILNQAFVTIERYNANRETFNKIGTLQYRFMARFGKDASQPFEKILKIKNELLMAAHLVGEYNIDVHHSRVLLDSKEKEGIEPYRRIIRWDKSEDDPTHIKVKEAIEEIESICKPIIDKPLSTPTVKDETASPSK